MTEYRDRDDIHADILRICSRKALMKTWVMYGTNTSYAQVQDHISKLITKGLLMKTDGRYSSTSYGLEWLRYYDAMRATENIHEETAVAQKESGGC
jgi:predicted transcriptional regulator